ncbi:pigment-dispersing hormone 1 peptides-like isoform X2 [Procambarus clarkii]|uniref:pigment-dispersing hormone 1 peptides-like isoform X2 n=1 Tax=Procambarus clarkii TaxID=6728 RepID=UPI003743C107
MAATGCSSPSLLKSSYSPTPSGTVPVNKLLLYLGFSQHMDFGRMRSAVLVVLVVVAVVAVLTRAQELKYSEREVVTNLAAQILRVVHGPWGTSAAPSKRNSELINALLGSPTLMGEVGRK